jgi:hypothetical protein
LAGVVEKNKAVGGRGFVDYVEVGVEAAAVLVRLREEGIGVESAARVAVGVFAGRWRR